MRERLRRRAPSPSGLALGGILALAFGLRLWGIRHGLPFVYNVDEASNFVPTAVSYYFTDSYNPHYFINPPAFSYLLHVVLGTWFGGWPFSAENEVGSAFATDPSAVFAVSRTTSAVLGTVAVAFVHLTGARLYDRRVGLVAAALMAVAFLPVFYSHLALNDVPALLPLAVSVYGSAGVLTRGRAVDYAVAGAGLGLAVATKYTAGIVVLPLIVAWASQLSSDRRAAMRGVVVGELRSPRFASCWRTRTRSCRSTSSGRTCAGRRRRPPASESSGSTTTRGFSITYGC